MKLYQQKIVTMYYHVGLQKRLNGALLVEDSDYILPCWSIEKIKWSSISKIMTIYYQVGLQKRLNGVLLVEESDYVLPGWSTEKIKWSSISRRQ